VMSTAVVCGAGTIGLVWTPLLRISAKDFVGEVGLVGEAVIGLVWTPLLIISENGVWSLTGVIGLV
jgi:hypothetical protein